MTKEETCTDCGEEKIHDSCVDCDALLCQHCYQADFGEDAHCEGCTNHLTK